MGEKTFQTASSTKLRACLNCAILKPASYFKHNGCPNCPFLETNRGKNFNFTTSGSYKGMIALVDPNNSWVGRWQRINQCEPGMYAMTVEGILGDEFIERIEQEGRMYINRSESFSLN